MRPIREIYDAFNNGGHYTNEEAICLRDHMEITANANGKLGPRFHLAFREANEVYFRLENVCEARGLNK